MLTKEQVRAARAYLDWDRKDLARESGVTLDQIVGLESGRTESPRPGILKEIEETFLHQGLTFKEGGVIPKADCTTRFEGEGWYLRMLDDVYNTLLNHKNPEAIILFGNEKLSPPEMIQCWEKIRTLGTKIRRIVKAGDTYLLGPIQEYKSIPAEFFNNHIILIYANKVGICVDENKMGLVIEDASLAQTFRLQTEFYFNILETPKESIVHEKI
jgi:transcriptional regulator with XRE-family HTH domain